MSIHCVVCEVVSQRIALRDTNTRKLTSDGHLRKEDFLGERVVLVKASMTRSIENSDRTLRGENVSHSHICAFCPAAYSCINPHPDYPERAQGGGKGCCGACRLLHLRVLERAEVARRRRLYA